MKYEGILLIVFLGILITGCSARENTDIVSPEKLKEETIEVMESVFSTVADENDALSEPAVSVAVSDEYVFAESSERELKRVDVYGLSADMMRIGRNEIYAKHGRIFMDSELQDYFDSKEWYQGEIEPDEFNESILSDVEKYNVTFLKDMEDVFNGSRFYMEILKDYEGQVIWICVDKDSSYEVYDNYILLHGGKILAAKDYSDEFDPDTVSGGDILELGGGIYRVTAVSESKILIEFQKRSGDHDNPDVGPMKSDSLTNVIPEWYWYIDRWEKGYNYFLESLQIGDWIDYEGPDGSGYNWYMLGDSECIAKETLYEGDIYFSTDCITHALKRPNLADYNETGITEYFDLVIDDAFKYPLSSLGFYKMDEIGEVVKYAEMYRP